MIADSRSRLLDSIEKEPEWMQRPFLQYLLNHSGAILLCIFLFGLYALFLSHKIDLVTADIGRHIRNGEILLHDTSVLKENFYSYTHPEFPVINHHWGSGLLFYFTYSLFGFVGVQLFFILLSFAALFAFLKTARLYAPWGVVGLIALPSIFLLAERTEIRPEVFSYLFAGIFFYILCLYRESQTVSKENTYDRMYFLTRRKALWLLPLFQILWVNTHIYFFLGPLILGAFLLESLIVRRHYFYQLLAVFMGALGAMFVNPFGYKTITETLNVFQNYGYRLAENQPVWFMEKLMRDPNFLIFKVVFVVCVLSLLAALVRNWRNIPFAHVCVIAGISALAWLAIRNLSLFGLFAIPFIAANGQVLLRRERNSDPLLQWSICLAGLALLLSLIFGWPRYFPYWQSFGWGLQKNNNAPIEFIRENHISGPYFNNYDIGGYLIFHLFPEERVFVDNRPEAYPADFFQKVYIPMQEDDSVWKRELEAHKFNAIIFSHRDATPWGQRFLIARLQDAQWAPVFVDSRVLILVRRVDENRPLIEKFLLPPETFRLAQ